MFAQKMRVHVRCVMDHVARLDTSPDASPDAPVCSVCGERVIGTGPGDQLRHAGEARRPRTLPARADMATVRRAQVVAERALTELTWTPHTTDADRAAAVVEALYAEGLISARPRVVRARRPAAAALPVSSGRGRRPAAAR
jgi:hypothetical protein